MEKYYSVMKKEEGVRMGHVSPLKGMPFYKKIFFDYP